MDVSQTRWVVYVGDDSTGGPPQRVSEAEARLLPKEYKTLLEERDLRPRETPSLINGEYEGRG